MISLAVVAILIGLLASFGAFVVALYKLRKDSRIFEPIVGGLRWLAIATIALYFCLLGAGGWIYLESQKSEEALCAFRGDLHSRVVGGEEFLKEHPQGFGSISAAEIEETIHNEIRTMQSLGNLEC